MDSQGKKYVRQVLSQADLESFKEKFFKFLKEEYLESGEQILTEKDLLLILYKKVKLESKDKTIEIEEIRRFLTTWYSWCERESNGRETVDEDYISAKTERMIFRIAENKIVLKLLNSPLMLMALALIDNAVTIGKLEYTDRSSRDLCPAFLFGDHFHEQYGTEEVRKRVYYAEWRDMILLMLAILTIPDVIEFINDIMKQPKKSLSQFLRLDVCTTDVEDESAFENAMGDLIKEIKAIAFNKGVPKLKAHCAEIYGRIGADDRDFTQFIPIETGAYDLEGIGSVNIDSFEIGQYPVTISWFELFIKAGGYQEDGLWTKEGMRWLKGVKAQHPIVSCERSYQFSNAPVTEVSWYEADAFCHWLTVTRKDGYRYHLPTTEQWQSAAAGFEKRKFPWGEWKEGNCNIIESEVGYMSAVGIFNEGNTPTGISDMAGNVWEWTHSEFGSGKAKDDFYFHWKLQQLVHSRNDNTIDEMTRLWKAHINKSPVLKGGSWYSVCDDSLCANSNSSSAFYRADFVGFRCARTLI